AHQRAGRCARHRLPRAQLLAGGLGVDRHHGGVVDPRRVLREGGPPVVTELPPPRTEGRYRTGVVCLGNICRSPMAEVVLTERVAEAGLDDRVEVASCGTGDWHVGHPMDRRAAATLSAAGYDPSRH